jgi:hypothetical protein
MPVALAEKSILGKIKDTGPFPNTPETPFEKVRRGEFEGIRWVRKTRSWAPDSQSVRIKLGVVAGNFVYNPTLVDKTFTGDAINSRKARRLAGVRDWQHRRPWVKIVPHYTPDQEARPTRKGLFRRKSG